MGKRQLPKYNREKFEAAWHDWANETRILAHSTDNPALWDKIKKTRIELMDLIAEVSREVYTPAGNLAQKGGDTDAR